MSKSSILIVEDNIELGDLFAEILTTADKAVFLIRDGQEALDYLMQANESVPDIVVLDMHLPHVPGDNLLRYIRNEERYSQTRVVVVTANALMSDAVGDMADIVMLKPISYEQISTIVSRLSPNQG
jgi:two-component system cell cycle response regulator DivK